MYTCYSNTFPQAAYSPSCKVKCLTLGDSNDLVRVLATMSVVEQKMSQSFPSSIIQ